MGVLTIILTALKGLVPLILEIWQGRGPSPLVVESEKAGAAEAMLKEQEAQNAEVTKAAAAADSVDAIVSDPDKLRAYEQADPNNVDNAKP
jgi:hypothetical protein